ncbi:MAG: hypothetical protein LUH19_02550 [Lachnospiraceae bacterium]|nr:hypothetical protein [Lachnospiraceae bacterium]
MSENELEYEYEIDLKDLCINVLRKWRAILLAAVVGAVLLGGFRVVSNLREEPGLAMSSSELEAAQTEVTNANKAITTAETAITTAETEITRLEGEITKAETTIETNEKSIDNLDNEIALAESQLENLNSFLDNYNAALEKLMEAGEMDAAMAETMTNYLVQIDTIQSSILSKETEIMNLYESGPKLEEANEKLLETIEDYEDQIEVQEEEIANQEDAIAQQEELIADLEEQMAEVAPVDLKSGVAKYIILGAFLGVCVVCAYVFLRYCFDKTVHLEEDLTRYTRLRVLGSVDYVEKDTSKKKNLIDRLLDQFSGIDSQEDHSSATQCGIAAAKIQVLTAKKRILVTGTIEENTIQKVSDDLKKHLPQQEYEVVCAENPMYHSQELLRMVDYELVLVEAPHVTKVKELLNLIRFLKLSDVKVIGIISVTE